MNLFKLGLPVYEKYPEVSDEDRYNLTTIMRYLPEVSDEDR